MPTNEEELTLPEGFEDLDEDTDDEVDDDLDADDGDDKDDEDEDEDDEDKDETPDPKRDIKHQAFAKMHKELSSTKKSLKEREKIFARFEKETGMSIEDYLNGEGKKAPVKKPTAKSNPVEDNILMKRIQDLEERTKKAEQASVAKGLVLDFKNATGMTNEEWSILRTSKKFANTLRDALEVASVKPKAAKALIRTEGAAILNKVRKQYATEMYGKNAVPTLGNKTISNETVFDPYAGVTSEEEFLAIDEKLNKKSKK